MPIRFIFVAPLLLVLPALMGQAPAPAPDTDTATEAAPPLASDGTAQLVHGDVTKAVATFTEALRDTGLANDRRATILNDRGVANARSGQTKQALEDYNRAVELFPEYPVAYNNRGNLLLAVGQLSEAIKDFDRAVLLAPGYAAAYSNRANAKMKLGRTSEAIADFTRAVELMPASAPPLSGRGLAYLAIGKPHAAVRDFSRAVSADTRFASAYRNRAEARMTIGQRDDAIEDLSRAVAFDVNNQELYVVRGYAYLLAGNTASALKDFSRAIELDPKSSAAFEGRGLANGLAEAPEDAYADLNRAIELDPRSPVAYAFRAVVYKQNGQPDIGSKDVETAIKLDPNSPEALWAEGEIAEASGQADVAITNLRRVIEIKPGWQFAADALKRLGAPVDDGDSKPLPALDIAKWHVYERGKDYFAVSDDYPLIRVPLEMIGEGAPKLLEWEIKAAPYSGYGILRFSGGRVATKSGFEDTELAAIIDINGNKVVAIQPNRQGDRVATWTWEGDHLQVASVDGVTDEYQLRRAAVAAASSGTGQRRYDSASSERQKRYAKPKTIFDLLFGN